LRFLVWGRFPGFNPSALIVSLAATWRKAEMVRLNKPTLEAKKMALLPPPKRFTGKTEGF
jgi:hypothetical protein